MSLSLDRQILYAIWLNRPVNEWQCAKGYRNSGRSFHGIYCLQLYILYGMHPRKEELVSHKIGKMGDSVLKYHNLCQTFSRVNNDDSDCHTRQCTMTNSNRQTDTDTDTLSTDSSNFGFIFISVHKHNRTFYGQKMIIMCEKTITSLTNACQLLN